MRILSFLLLFAVISSGSGCTKTEETTYHGTMWNGEAEALTVDIYRTMDDYNNATNLLKRVVVPASGEVEIPQELESGVTYYADIYSEDYDMSNWGIDPSLPVANTTPDMDPAVRLLVRTTLVRRMLLKDSLLSTKWKAFAVETIGSGVWNSLPEHQKHRNFLFRRDMTGEYTYKDNAGHEQEISFRIISLPGTTNFSIIFTGGEPSSGSVSLLPYLDPFGNVRLDTMSSTYVLPPSGSSPYRYFFARE